MTDLAAAPIDWNVAALRADLAPLLPGLSIEIAASLPSTNSELLARARESAVRARASDPGGAVASVRRSVESRAFGRHDRPLPPCLLIAERQTAGRGRQGRHWASAVGASLTFSLALDLSARDWSGLSLAIGVALAEALDDSAEGPSRIGLKWPNDLWLLDRAAEPDAPIGRKLGGILIETVASAAEPRVAVIGIGLNLAAFDAADVSTGLAALHELDPTITGPSALRRVARPLATALLRFEADGFAPFAEAFARRDVLRDRPVRTTSTQTPDGIARGVQPNGGLRIETPEGIVAVTSGEVSVRPVASTAAGASA